MDRVRGSLLLKIICVLCIILGLSEFVSGLAVLGVVGFIMFPWFDALLSTGGWQIIIAVVGVVFGLSYMALGVLGFLFEKNRATLLVYLCSGVFVFHVAFMAASFFAGGFIYVSILLLSIPILYLVGASQAIANRKLRNTIVAYSFIAPNLVGFSIFTLIPMGFALALAFMQWNIADNSISFVGLANFMRMRTDHLFWPSLRNTIYFTAASVPLTMAFSLGLALLLNQRIRGRAIFRSIMFFPHVASMIAMAAVWNQIFHPSWGPINQFLMNFMDSPPRWTVHPWILPNIIFFTAWRNMGYYMIIYLAGLQGIPEELYEAASIDGAGKWNKFRYITWPQLRFVTFFVSVLLTIMSFRVFDPVIMITNSENPGSSSTMMVIHVFRVAFINWDFGYASAVALVLLALVLTITIVQFVMQKRYQRDY